MSSPPEVDLVPAISNKALKFACQLLNNLNFPNINHIWKKTSHFLNIEFLDKFVSYSAFKIIKSLPFQQQEEL